MTAFTFEKISRIGAPVAPPMQVQGEAIAEVVLRETSVRVAGRAGVWRRLIDVVSMARLKQAQPALGIKPRDTKRGD